MDSHRPAASSDAELVDAARHLGQRRDHLLAVVAHACVEDEAELTAAQLQSRRPPATDTIVSIRRAVNQWPSTAQSAQDYLDTVKKHMTSQAGRETHMRCAATGS